MPFLRILPFTASYSFESRSLPSLSDCTSQIHCAEATGRPLAPVDYALRPKSNSKVAYERPLTSCCLKEQVRTTPVTNRGDHTAALSWPLAASHHLIQQQRPRMLYTHRLPDAGQAPPPAGATAEQGRGSDTTEQTTFLSSSQPATSYFLWHLILSTQVSSLNPTPLQIKKPVRSATTRDTKCLNDDHG